MVTGLEDDDPSCFLTLTPVDDANLAQAVTAAITVEIDPEAVRAGG